MKIKVKDNKEIEYISGSGEINTNDVMRQLIEVEPETALAQGERLWIAYTCKADEMMYSGEIRMYEETGIFRALIPQEVLEKPGEWEAQLFKRIYSTIDTSKYTQQTASNKFTFTVASGLVLEDGSYVNNGTVESLYQDAQTAVNKIKEQSEKIDEILAGETKLDLNYNATTEELTFSVIKETN